ncbi:MAG TPA: hypothetical protein VGF59_23230 [Bryobacteraceae bacterium]
MRFADIGFAANSFASPVYYGYALAHFWGDQFGIEGELIHLKVYGQMQPATTVQGTVRGTPVSGAVIPATIVSQFDITHGVNPILGNFVFRHALGARDSRQRRRAYVNARAGVGITVPHHENTILGVHSESYQVGRPAMQAGAGVELRLWRRLYGETQYKFTWTRQRVDVADGSAKVALRSHHAIFGVSVHF